MRQALASEALEIDDWRTYPLQNAVGGATGGVSRIERNGHAGRRPATTLLVLKVVRPPAGATADATPGPPTTAPAPASKLRPSSWKREVLPYESDLLRDLLGPARIPRMVLQPYVGSGHRLARPPAVAPRAFAILRALL